MEIGRQIFLLYITIWLQVVTTQATLAQETDIEFHHITVSNGLPSNTVNGVLRDSRGFIWIASENGISRYDGYGFTNFRSLENDTASVSSNITYVVFEDREQRLWVGSAGGLDLFNRDLDQFDRHYLAGIPVRAIYQDRYKALWIGTDLGLYKYNPNKNTFVKPFAHLFAPGITYNTITTVAEDGEGNLWIGTAMSGVYVYDPLTQAFAQYISTPGGQGTLSSNDVRKIIRDKKGRMWLATYGGGINVFRPETKTFRTFMHNPGEDSGIASNQIPVLWEDEYGRLWIGTDGEGLDIFDPSDNSFQHVVHSSYHGRSLSNNVVRSISSDGRGGVWIGTYAGGINFFNHNTEAFFHYKVPTHNGNSSVTSFAEDGKGHLWIGTDGGGLCYFDPAEGKFTNWRYDAHNMNSLSDNRVLSLLLDHSGFLWIGTYLGGLCRYNPITGKFIRYAAGDKSRLSSNIVWALLEDSRKRIWVGTNKGLNLFDARTNTFQCFDINNSAISNNMVRALFEDHVKKLWIGTQEGLNVGEGDGENFNIEKRDWYGEYNLSDDWIRTISEDHAGNLLVGTFEGGLNMLDRSSGRLTVFKESDGLSNNIISSVLEDNSHNIWIGTGRGLSRLENNGRKVKSYTVKDGLQNAQFNINAAFKTQNGAFLFGGINGFTLFVPERINRVESNKFPPTMALTGFKIFNKEVIPGQVGSPLQQHINETREIVLSYDQHVLTFEFAALNFIQPENNRYAYRLVGFETEWNYVNDKRSATYTNLAPGDYVFEVKASNNAGVWNEKGLSLAVVITPPFWKTWWFTVVVVLCLCFSALLFYSVARKRIREKIRINRFIAELEIKALITQMNPHFIFNCLTSIQELITMKKLSEAMHYLNQFSRLMRSVLRSSENSFIALEQEVALLESYLQLESMRFDKQFKYILTVDESIDPEEVVIPSFLTQPFVENALWHGLMHKSGYRSLAISFVYETDQTLLCTIDDNGIGREQADKMKKDRKAHVSMGIRIIYERIKLMKQQNHAIDLQIIDKMHEGRPAGTTVVMKLPMYVRPQ